MKAFWEGELLRYTDAISVSFSLSGVICSLRLCFWIFQIFANVTFFSRMQHISWRTMLSIDVVICMWNLFTLSMLMFFLYIFFHFGDEWFDSLQVTVVSLRPTERNEEALRVPAPSPHEFAIAGEWQFLFCPFSQFALLFLCISLNCLFLGRDFQIYRDRQSSMGEPKPAHLWTGHKSPCLNVQRCSVTLILHGN